MSPVIKNVLTLIFFVMFLSWISRAEACVLSSTCYEKMFYKGLPDSAWVNTSDLDKCGVRNWTYCEVV